MQTRGEKGLEIPVSSYDQSKIDRIRSSIVDRIITSQRDYICTLTFITKTMKNELERLSERIEYEVEEGQVRALFANVNDILEAEVSLMSKLSGDDCDEGKTPEQASDIGSIFVNMKDSLKVYDVYCSNHSRAEQVATEVLKMNTMKETLEKWSTVHPFNPASLKRDVFLHAAIKQPLYHICEISVLLKMLAVFTNFTHPDLRDIVKAQLSTQGALAPLEKAKQKLLMEATYRVCDDMQAEWDDGGLCNKQGFITKRGGSVRSWKIRYFTLRGYELKYFDEPVDDKALGTLDLRQCEQVLIDNNSGKPNSFGIVFPERTYYMYCTSANERTEWVNMLAWKVYLLRDANYRACTALAQDLTKVPSVLSLIS